MPRFLDDGLYFEHLKRWLDYFPRRQIKVFLYEDVRERPAWVMEEVCAHIRAPFHFAEQLEHERVNDGSAHFLPLPMRKILSPLKDAVKPIRGNPFIDRERSVMALPGRAPSLSPTCRAHMEELYAHVLSC